MPVVTRSAARRQNQLDRVNAPVEQDEDPIVGPPAHQAANEPPLEQPEEPMEGRAHAPIRRRDERLEIDDLSG